MQSLQTYLSPDESGDVLRRACAALGLRSMEALDDLRVRSRERTLGLLALLGPDSTLYARSVGGASDGSEDAEAIKGAKGAYDEASDLFRQHGVLRGRPLAALSPEEKEDQLAREGGLKSEENEALKGDFEQRTKAGHALCQGVAVIN